MRSYIRAGIVIVGLSMGSGVLAQPVQPPPD